MVFIRSLLFKLCFVLITLLEMLLFAPIYFFLPHKTAWRVPRFWARSVFWLQKHLIGLEYRFEGLENLPEGACIIAAKHQSVWETMALPLVLPDPTFILKRELLWIPFFGWYLGKMGMIPINRGAPLQALRRLIVASKQKAAQKRQIVIFPEGTRKEAGAAPDYKIGVFPIYAELGLPVVPVALNAGLYWSKKYFCLQRGTIECRFLPPISAGLPRKEFMQKLENSIEKECLFLFRQAAQSKNPPFIPPAVQKQLQTEE